MIAFERLHGLCPSFDRGVASDLEMTDHLDGARAGLRLSSSLASKYGARGAFGIHGVAFALLIPQLPIGPVDLDDGMSSLAQEPGQAGAIGPGALDTERLDGSH
jgi:hypothetical protein